MDVNSASYAHAQLSTVGRGGVIIVEKRVGLVYTINMALSRLRTAEPSARYGHAGVGCGGNLFVWAGKGGPVSSSVLERFNVVSTSWQEPRHLRGQSLPDGLRLMAVTSDGERAYCFGGVDGSEERHNSLYCLDLSSLLSRLIIPTTASESPSPRTSSAMVHYRGKLVLHGGDTGAGSASDELFVFDLDTSEAYLEYCNTSILVRVHFQQEYMYAIQSIYIYISAH